MPQAPAPETEADLRLFLEPFSHELRAPPGTAVLCGDRASALPAGSHVPPRQPVEPAQLVAAVARLVHGERSGP